MSLHRGVVSLQCGIERLGCVAERLIWIRNRISASSADQSNYCWAEERKQTMNATALDQSRLDVVAKTRSNIFNWRGQFTPQFVDYILDSFAISGQQILDPFCGSGTVLLESATKGLPAI